MSSRNGQTVPARQIRCATYTRKSSEEGLEQDFNSPDAQRESAEAYIASQKAEELDLPAGAVRRMWRSDAIRALMAREGNGRGGSATTGLGG